MPIYRPSNSLSIGQAQTIVEKGILIGEVMVSVDSVKSATISVLRSISTDFNPLLEI